MKHQRLIFCLLLFVSILAAACSTSTPTAPKTVVKIVSLHEQWANLQAKAAEWYPDAYLVKADIPIQGAVSPWLISASFQSPSHDKESLGVTLELDGSFTTQRFQHPDPVYQIPPIRRNDISVDSQEALNLLLDDEGLKFLKEHPSHCSALNLERDPSQPAKPTVWILRLSSCGLSPSKLTFLDPTTHEIKAYSK